MNDVLLEEYEQIEVVNFLEGEKLKGTVLFFSAIPASTYTKSWNQKRTNWATGVRRGVSDLIILVKKGILFCEMKRRKGSKTSLEQKQFIGLVNAYEAVEGKICYGADEAIAWIKEFL